MAGTSWPTLTAGAIARASDVNAHFAWLEGSIVPMTAGSSTDNTYDLGTTTANWRTIYTYSLGGTSTAKGIAVGTTTVVNHSDVAFEIAGTRAFLPPRMTTAQKNNLAGVNGMVLYDSTLNQLQKYENGAWKVMGANNIGIQLIANTSVSWAAATAAASLITYSGGGRLRALQFTYSGGNAGDGVHANIVLDGNTIGTISFTGNGPTTDAAYLLAMTTSGFELGFTNTTARQGIDTFFKSSFKIEGSSAVVVSAPVLGVLVDWEHE